MHLEPADYRPKLKLRDERGEGNGVIRVTTAVKQGRKEPVFVEIRSRDASGDMVLLRNDFLAPEAEKPERSFYCRPVPIEDPEGRPSFWYWSEFEIWASSDITVSYEEAA